MLAVVESELSWQETHVAGIISGIMLIFCFENNFTCGSRVVKHVAFRTQQDSKQAHAIVAQMDKIGASS